MLTVVGFVLLVYLALEIARTSPWGRVMTAIRENEAAARAAGKNVTRLRIESFVVGAVIIGLAGAFYAQQLRFIEPTNAFDPTKLTFLVVMLIMGGSGNNRGAVLGGLMLWVIWSGTELVICFGANVLGDVFRFVAQCTGHQSKFLAPVPDRADTSVRLAEIPERDTTRGASRCPWGKTNEVRD